MRNEVENGGFWKFIPVVELLYNCVNESINVGSELLQAALVTWSWKNTAGKIFISLKLELGHELAVACLTGANITRWRNMRVPFPLK